MTSFVVGKPSLYRAEFEGSDRLFRACWRMLAQFSPTDDVNVMEILDSVASEKVNNPRSSFYIYGE